MTTGVYWFIISVLIPVLPWFSSDKSSTDENVQAILQLHAQTREGHLKNDVNLIVPNIADRFVDIQNGNLQFSTREELQQKFARYLEHTKYFEWSDVIAPSVHVSSDGQMAWAAIKIKARFTNLSEPAPRKEHEFTSSWISVYEKQPAGWQMVGISSGCDPPCGVPSNRR